MNTKERLSLVISGAPCRGITEGDFRDIIEGALLKGHSLIADVSGNWLKVAGEYPLKLMKVNREELKEAFQLDAFLFTESLKRFKKEAGIEELVVTDGKNGSIAYAKDNERRNK